MPHFWDIRNETGPFKSRPRLMDPETLRATGLNGTEPRDLDAFHAFWHKQRPERSKDGLF